MVRSIISSTIDLLYDSLSDSLEKTKTVTGLKLLSRLLIASHTRYPLCAESACQVLSGDAVSTMPSRRREPRKSAPSLPCLPITNDGRASPAVFSNFTQLLVTAGKASSRSRNSLSLPVSRLLRATKKDFPYRSPL